MVMNVEIRKSLTCVFLFVFQLMTKMLTLLPRQICKFQILTFVHKYYVTKAFKN